MFELALVRQAYGGRTVLMLDALRIERDARLAIVGPNGSGKSTLLRLLAFLEAPLAGTIALQGRPARTAGGRGGAGPAHGSHWSSSGRSCSAGRCWRTSRGDSGRAAFQLRSHSRARSRLWRSCPPTLSPAVRR